MDHIFYDFYMRFDSMENAEKAQKYYYDKHKAAIGGKFVINDNGVCSLSLRDEVTIITELYQFGMKRFIITDNNLGLIRENGVNVFKFITDNDKIFSFEYDNETFERLNEFLKTDIYKDGYIRKKGEMPPYVKRVDDSMGIDDTYNMMNVNVPGFDI